MFHINIGLRAAGIFDNKVKMMGAKINGIRKPIRMTPLNCKGQVLLVGLQLICGDPYVIYIAVFVFTFFSRFILSKKGIFKVLCCVR